MLSGKKAGKLILVLLIVLYVHAVEAGRPEATLKVGISLFSPFVILAEEKPIGLSVDLWQILASEMEMDYEFVKCTGVSDKLQRLKDGRIDIAIGGISITEAREQFFDFTHPTYHTGLDILIPASGKPTLIALPPGSPLRERINRALLRLVESDEMEAIRKKWLGEPTDKKGEAAKGEK